MEFRRSCCCPHPAVHTHLQQFLGLPKGTASLDPQCSERGRAGLPGCGSAVHAEKTEIKSTMVLESRQQSLTKQLKKKKKIWLQRQKRPPALKMCSLLLNSPLNPVISDPNPAVCGTASSPPLNERILVMVPSSPRYSCCSPLTSVIWSLTAHLPSGSLWQERLAQERIILDIFSRLPQFY